MYYEAKVLTGLRTLGLTSGGRSSSYMLRMTSLGTHLAHITMWPSSQQQQQVSLLRGRRPRLCQSVISTTYWGREDDLDIEF